MPVALITGIAGQDGSYLAELLLSEGYGVAGLAQPLTEVEKGRIAHLEGKIEWVEGNLLDTAATEALVASLQPDEIYNFAAFSFLATSVERPVEAGDLMGLAVTRLLEAIRSRSPRTRFLQSSSSEIFGDPEASPQTEETPLKPRNPYGAAKAYAHAVVGCYRALHGTHASCAILYNHESPRRGPEFVTRKVTRGAAMIKAGLAREIVLGDLSARRDWGYAPDYVEAMRRMVRAGRGEDFVLATGETHSVEELCAEAFGHVGLDWRDHVRTTPEPFRPPDRGRLVGDPSKARRLLGWEPTVPFREVVRRMVDADAAEIARKAPGTAGGKR